MTIYILTIRYEYEGSEVLKVFSTRAAANRQRFFEIAKDKYNEFEIEEHEVKS